MSSPTYSATAEKKTAVALVLQGGGALGAYHIGAFQAITEAGYSPDWVAGISIGAINAAIIVGNSPENRLHRLESLWQTISWPDEWGSVLKGPYRTLFNQWSASRAILLGQPHFWTNRLLNPLLLPYIRPEAASFCDTAPMLDTLRHLADFDRINSKKNRLSLGATHVTSGTLHFFDNHREKIEPHHVLASGSLPPGFPPTRIGQELYWDGGCVSNTPLDALLVDNHADHTLVFMIDLFSPSSGREPTNMEEVIWRQKQIQYASRTSHHIQALATRLNWSHQLHATIARYGEGSTPLPKALHLPMRPGSTMDILHIVYHPTEDQLANSDAEFSRPSIADRRAAGYADLKYALRERPWSQPAIRAERPGVMVHTCHHQKITSDWPI